MDPTVGAFMAKHFAAGWKKVGTFAIVGKADTNMGVQKVGGNVAAYFCTPDLRVLGAVGGPVSPQVFLREAERAVALAESTSLGFSEDAGSRVLEAPMPREGLWSGTGQANLRVWRILKELPLAPIDILYRDVFEDALGETVSDAPVRFEDWLNSRRALRNRRGG
ncbi:MAG TPA: hypothetical protein VF950_24420 [Planctomycetota bacterium]